MSTTIQKDIARLLKEVQSFNRNDVLVHVDNTNTRLFFGELPPVLPVDKFPKRTLAEARTVEKESGINPLCRASGYLSTGEKHMHSTPIVLTPIRVKRDRVRNQLEFKCLEDESFINPYVEFILRSKDVPTEKLVVAEVFETLEAMGFTVNRARPDCIGNFHHHRYSVLRDLESLVETSDFSPPLLSLFGVESSTTNSLKLSDRLLFPADTDHEVVFTQFEKKPVVIQGPPGTGKSQVLSNIIGKLLDAKKSAIVLSEKRVALEVLVQKLQQYDLDRLGFIVTSNTASKDLLRQLENNWHFFETEHFKDASEMLLSPDYRNNLQFTLDLLNQPNTIGGLSIYAFRNWFNTLETSSQDFLENAPSVPDFLSHAEALKKVYANNLHETVRQLTLGTLQRDDFEQVIEEIRNWKNKLSQIEKIVPFDTWADLKYLTRQAILCQKLENHRDKPYQDLYRKNSRGQKRFFKLFRQWKGLKQQEKAVKLPAIHWKTKPTPSDLYQLKVLIDEPGFWQRRQLKRFWKRLTDAPISGVDDVVKYYDKTKQIQSSISQLTVEFCELGIAEPEKDIELLYYSIEQFIREEWEILETLSTKQKSFLTSSHQLLNACISQLDRLLVLQDTSVVLKILDQVEHHFSSLLLHQSQLSLLPQSIHSALGFAQDFNHLQAVIANSHWTKFQKHFPSFSSFDMQNLHQKAEAVISSREKEFKAFARYILHSVSKEFKYYHELLSTPAQKLNARDKALKKRLRKGKSLLVKEFSKTRSHPSIRNLMQSEAREWIQLLTPIWLSNPTQLSKIFPLEKGLFHVAIFDEASQIILQHGLGALQRSEHAIIAGDSKQMGPSSYFQAKGEHTRDLLHQASFYWNTCFLSHHYRSLHPDLIAFSNKVFYDNQLITYQASNIEQPVRLHYVKNAVYIERKNLKEAKVVADYVTQLMKTDEHIGVVAFSEEQLDTIINALTIKTRMELLERVDAGHAFFKTLENVQGDECDHLVISFGYGYNEEQQFAMRFGPMNTENGQRRLNVLLTRARKRLDFFASVQHSDFKLSENESINTLRQWFAFAESLKTESNSLQLPFEGRTEREGNRLTLFEPHRIHPDALSFLTFQEVMESRGWQLNYA